MADGFVPSYNNEEERLEEIEKNWVSLGTFY